MLPGFGEYNKEPGGKAFFSCWPLAVKKFLKSSAPKLEIKPEMLLFSVHLV